MSLRKPVEADGSRNHHAPGAAKKGLKHRPEQAVELELSRSRIRPACPLPEPTKHLPARKAASGSGAVILPVTPKAVALRRPSVYLR
jgi:hypothetical protein